MRSLLAAVSAFAGTAPFRTSPHAENEVDDGVERARWEISDAREPSFRIERIIFLGKKSDYLLLCSYGSFCWQRFFSTTEQSEKSNVNGVFFEFSSLGYRYHLFFKD
jgi:hypothetical protein